MLEIVMSLKIVVEMSNECRKLGSHVTVPFINRQTPNRMLVIGLTNCGGSVEMSVRVWGVNVTNRKAQTCSYPVWY